MKSIFLLLLLTVSLSSFAQDNGSVIFNGKTIPLTGYRTRVSNEKRWIIADAKADGKLYSITITIPDITAESVIKTDAKHTVTFTISNTDYSNASNHCFDGGSTITVTPKNGKFAASGTDLQSGDCFGKSSGSEKISFTIKP